LYIADKYDWKKINCVLDNKLRSIESIHNEIYKIVLDSIKPMETILMECYFFLVRKVYIIVKRDYSLKLCIFK
ncbi:hypothetical protein ACTPEF_25465, partial [Clostridioides difficile]